jgi:hypothetical protein
LFVNFLADILAGVAFHSYIIVIIAAEVDLTVTAEALRFHIGYLVWVEAGAICANYDG